MWEPAFTLRGWFSCHKKIKIYFSWLEMGFIGSRTWGYWMELLLFASPHSRTKGLATGAQLDHELHCIFQSSCRKGREKKKKKAIFLMLSWGWSVLWSLEGNNTALWVFGWDFIKPEYSERGNISWPVVMKFHCFCVSQETRGNFWSVLSTMKLQNI